MLLVCFLVLLMDYKNVVKESVVVMELKMTAF